MAVTVNQPTINPTNKLTSATVAAAVYSVAGLIVRNLWPEWYDESTWAAVLPVLIFGAGWVIRDKATPVTIVEEE
jgi:hypothetical protein